MLEKSLSCIILCFRWFAFILLSFRFFFCGKLLNFTFFYRPNSRRYTHPCHVCNMISVMLSAFYYLPAYFVYFDIMAGSYNCNIYSVNELHFHVFGKYFISWSNLHVVQFFFINFVRFVPIKYTYRYVRTSYIHKFRIDIFKQELFCPIYFLKLKSFKSSA